MHVIRRTLLITIPVIIIIVFVMSMYPLTQRSIIKLENHSDFNSIRNNFIQEEIILIQEDIYYSWSLSIPKINLVKVQVQESVDDEILNSYIGHFDFSSYFNGNVCLAAHNNGYTNNYFKDLYKLEIGDEISYEYMGNKREYYVSEKKVVSQDDIFILQDRGINELTLVTCVSGSPDLRLCIKASSKE